MVWCLPVISEWEQVKLERQAGPYYKAWKLSTGNRVPQKDFKEGKCTFQEDYSDNKEVEHGSETVAAIQ